jgi:hypothetical protein
VDTPGAAAAFAALLLATPATFITVDSLSCARGTKMRSAFALLFGGAGSGCVAEIFYLLHRAVTPSAPSPSYLLSHLR